MPSAWPPDASPGKADDEEDLRESQGAEIVAKARAVRLDGGLAAANGVVVTTVIGRRRA